MNLADVSKPFYYPFHLSWFTSAFFFTLHSYSQHSSLHHYKNKNFTEHFVGLKNLEFGNVMILSTFSHLLTSNYRPCLWSFCQTTSSHS